MQHNRQTLNSEKEVVVLKESLGDNLVLKQNNQSKYHQIQISLILLQSKPSTLLNVESKLLQNNGHPFTKPYCSSDLIKEATLSKLVGISLANTFTSPIRKNKGL